MKRCPECKRDYTDETLLYCLDDGTALLDGPSSADENKTALLPEAETRALTKQPADLARRPAIRKAIVMGIAVMMASGFILAAYFYFGSRGGTDRINSIAVIPFINETGNPELEYLSDGITENLIAGLGRLPNLNVKSRSAAFRYKGREKEIRTIGRELAVPAIVSGRVVQQGPDITLYI